MDNFEDFSLKKRKKKIIILTYMTVNLIHQVLKRKFDKFFGSFLVLLDDFAFCLKKAN